MGVRVFRKNIKSCTVAATKPLSATLCGLIFIFIIYFLASCNIENSNKETISTKSVLYGNKTKTFYLNFKNLDKICTKSDGESSEKLQIILAEAMELNLKETILFFEKHPNSCLEKRLIESYSGDISVYEISDRKYEISKLRTTLLIKAEKLNLPESSIKKIEEIVQKIRPEMFD